MIFDLAYVCDAWPAIGMGHLARALGVLAELTKRAPGLRLGLAGRFSESSGAFFAGRLPAGVEVFDEDGSTWSARVVALDTMAEPGNPSALDGARVARLQERCREFVLVSSAMKVETVPGIDMLIDHMPEVDISGPRPGRCLLGFRYAPVMPEFLDVDPVPPERAETLVAVLGGSDRQTGPEAVVKLLTEGIGDSFGALEMVVSPHYPAGDLEKLRRRHRRWSFYQNVPEMALLMARAKAVLCTYGNATYESLALGRPTFVLAYRKFQEEYAEFLESRGLVVACGRFDNPRMNRLTLLRAPETLASLAAAARQAGVGCGVQNIATALLEEVERVQVA